ncbi:MAG TPA: hypothetical protein VF189_06630, partial [Patescibacteria group bacterium]
MILSVGHVTIASSAYIFVIVKEIIRKALTIVASIAIVLQSFTPLVALAPQVAYAQEVSPTPIQSGPTDAPAPTDSVTPTTDQTSPAPTNNVTPSDTVTPSPDSSVTTTPSDTPTLTDTPTDTVTPTDSVTTTPDNTTPSTSTDVTNNPSQAPPTDTATPTPDNSSNASGHLDTTLLSHVAADSLDLSSSNDQSATLSTDKADYSPTDTAVISGSGFVANKSYNLEIVSSDAPAVDLVTTITTDSNGSFVYAYQLDGNYRPNYTVYVKEGDKTIATTTFTDSATTPSVDLYSQCSNNLGSGFTTGDTGCRWTNGDLNSSNSKYYEGDATPQRLAIKDLTTGDHTVTIQYDTTKGGKHAYDFIA